MNMMDSMMGMMAGMGLLSILRILFLILAAIYLVKRIFFDHSGRRDND